MNRLVFPEMYLDTPYKFDKALLKERNKLVIVRFGRENEIKTKVVDDLLIGIKESIYPRALIYFIDTDLVTEFNETFELYDSFAIMFFYRNKHIMIDTGSGNNNKIDWLIESKKELTRIIETIYRGVRKGKRTIFIPMKH